MANQQPQNSSDDFDWDKVLRELEESTSAEQLPEDWYSTEDLANASGGTVDNLDFDWTSLNALPELDIDLSTTDYLDALATPLYASDWCVTSTDSTQARDLQVEGTVGEHPATPPVVEGESREELMQEVRRMWEE